MPAPSYVRPNSLVYWFGVRIGLAIAFITAYLVNTWLISTGVKDAR